MAKQTSLLPWRQSLQRRRILRLSRWTSTGHLPGKTSRTWPLRQRTTGWPAATMCRSSGWGRFSRQTQLRRRVLASTAPAGAVSWSSSNRVRSKPRRAKHGLGYITAPGNVQVRLAIHPEQRSSVRGPQVNARIAIPGDHTQHEQTHRCGLRCSVIGEGGPGAL